MKTILVVGNGPFNAGSLTMDIKVDTSKLEKSISKVKNTLGGRTMPFKFMTKTARRKARKGAKKTPTIAMMTKNPGNSTSASKGKWSQGAYRSRQIDRMEREGFSSHKALTIANKNAGL